MIYKAFMTGSTQWLSSAGRPRRSLRILLLASICLPLAICLLGLGLLIDRRTHHSIEYDHGGKLATEARRFADITDDAIRRQVAELRSHAAALLVLNLHHEPERLAEWLQTLREHIPGIDWIGFADADGIVRAASNVDTTGASVVRQPWFTIGKDSTTAVGVHPVDDVREKGIGDIGGQWRLVDVAIPLRDQQDKLLGVLGAHMHRDWLSLHHPRYPDAPLLEQQADIIVADSGGQIRLGHPRLLGVDLASLVSFREGQSGGRGWTRETWPDGRDYLVGFTPNPGHVNSHMLNWVTLVRLPADAIATVSRPIATTSWGLAAGMTLLFACGAGTVLYRSWKPIERALADITLIIRHGGRVSMARSLPPEIMRLALATNRRMRAAESRDAAELARTRFVADLSHEIRISLHSLMGLAGMLRGRLSTQSDLRDADQLIRCGDELRLLMDDLLDTAAIEEGRLRLDMRDVALADLVRFNADLFAPLARAPHVAWHVEIAIHDRTTVRADPLRLSQILRNLMSNAVKFTHDGEIRIRVVHHDEQAAPHEGNASSDGWVDILIEDTGIGMNVSEQELVFGRYHRAGDAKAWRHNGSGLGLSLTRAMVHAMGGTLSLHSSPGKGTCLCVRLRISKMHGDEAESETGGAATAAPLQYLDVLVVDDMDLHRTILRRWLERQGHRVWDASNGKDAVGLASSRPFDLILLDLDLPDISGCDVARDIRTSRGPSCACPMFAITGHGFDDDVAASRSVGIQVHLLKPLDFKALHRHMNDIKTFIRPDADLQNSRIQA